MTSVIWQTRVALSNLLALEQKSGRLVSSKTESYLSSEYQTVICPAIIIYNIVVF